jgi:hypothetical protein
MLEWETSGQEHEKWIPRWNGNLLHSQRNPEREANLWVTQNKPLIEGCHTAFVLGLSGGYHIQSLIDQYPDVQVIVIEAHESFKTSASPYVRKLLSDVRLFVGTEPYVLMRNRDLEDHLKRAYCVLEYKQATKISMDYYRQVKSALLGRDWKSFNFHVKLREQTWMNQYNFIEKENSLISVKHIAAEIEKQTHVTPEMAGWLCLRELVK